jgi:hypothetical protein
MVGFAIREVGSVTEFWVTGPWGNDSRQAFLDAGAERLVLNYAHGFCEPGLGFPASCRCAIFGC